MTRSFALVAALLFTVLTTALLQGCGSSTAKAAGTYELDKEAMKASMQAEIDKIEDEGEKMMAGMMMGMVDGMTMTFVLNEDGTVDASTTVMGQVDSAKGTWTLKGSTITFTMTETDAGDPETMTGTLKGDSIELNSPDEDEMPFNLVFNKKKA